MRHAIYLVGPIVMLLVSAGAAPAQQCGDVDNSGTVVATDALLVLKAAVGTPVALVCGGDCAALEQRVAQLEALLANVSLQGDTLVITGKNLRIVDGTGDTAGEPNGLGNLIVGYNEDANGDAVRTGSHNIVVGRENTYTSYGGIVAGYRNDILGPEASITGGAFNSASGPQASVTGGSGNTASGNYASVTGGTYNTASGESASVTGGGHNETSGLGASVTGGSYNLASNTAASVTGGTENLASNRFASVTGGYLNTASGESSVALGGHDNEASGDYSIAP